MSSEPPTTLGPLHDDDLLDRCIGAKLIVMPCSKWPDYRLLRNIDDLTKTHRG